MFTIILLSYTPETFSLPYSNLIRPQHALHLERLRSAPGSDVVAKSTLNPTPKPDIRDKHKHFMGISLP